MTHLVSITFFFGVLVGLAALLERMLRENGRAIHDALRGTWSGATSFDAALERIGTCLRASFPTGDQEALSPDLGRLVLQLSSENPLRVKRA